MPTRFLSDTERHRLIGWPTTVPEAELAVYYLLDPADLDHIGQRRGDGNRLGFALQLCALRHLGFVPDDLRRAPPTVLASLASQLQAPVLTIADYADRARHAPTISRRSCRCLATARRVRPTSRP